MLNCITLFVYLILFNFLDCTRNQFERKHIAGNVQKDAKHHAPMDLKMMETISVNVIENDDMKVREEIVNKVINENKYYK